MATIVHQMTAETARAMVTSAVHTLVSDVTGCDVDNEDEFDDLNFDNLDRLELAMNLEDHLYIEVSDKIVENASTVGMFIEMVLDESY